MLYDSLGRIRCGYCRSVFDPSNIVHEVLFFVSSLSRLFQLYNKPVQPPVQPPVLRSRQFSRSWNPSSENQTAALSYDSSASDRRSVGMADSADLKTFVEVVDVKDCELETGC